MKNKFSRTEKIRPKNRVFIPKERTDIVPGRTFEVMPDGKTVYERDDNGCLRRVKFE